MSTKPPFIDSQQLLELVCPAGAEYDFLSPERFGLTAVPDAGEASEVGRGTGRAGDPRINPRPSRNETRPALQTRKPGWYPVGASDQTPAEARAGFLAQSEIQHLCLTIGGGIGKSTALEQVAYLRQTADRGHLSLRIEAAELPLSANQFLGNSPEQAASQRPPLLVDRFQNSEATKEVPGVDAWRLIHRKIRERKFSLLVDAFDQVDLKQSSDRRRMIRALADFLIRYPNVRCVVTGRPYAIGDYWRELFGRTANWKLAQIAAFNKQEQRRYLGDGRFDRLTRIEADVRSVPRALKRIREMLWADLESFRTAADVYWAWLREELEVGMERQASDLQLDDAVALFSLLAFEMSRRKISVWVKPGAPFEKFRAQVHERHDTWLQRRGIQTFTTFKRALDELGKLNLAMEHAVMGARGLNQIRWQDKTIQDMFAAVWVTRYSTSRDHRWLGKHRFVRPDKTTHFVEELWKLAAGMPDHELVFAEKPYAQAMAVLYAPQGDPDRPHEPSATRRSTEIIYRSWPTMLRLAGYPAIDDWCEPDLIEPTQTAQADARRLVERTVGRCSEQDPAKRRQLLHQQIETEPNLAKRSLMHFLCEFPGIQAGTHGADAREIAVDFESWFQRIPTHSTESLDFWIGDGDGDVWAPRQQEASLHAPFELAKFPVTNAVCRLFDAAHSRFSGGQNPADSLDWYDAWCVSVWLHGRLPDEFEWEYACRAQPGRDLPPSRWCCGNEKSELSAYAWFGQDWASGTRPVGRKLANVFGLFDMHGNVWEWTSSWHADDPQTGRDRTYVGLSRVLRGGSFDDVTDFCRSAYRSLRHPSVTDRFRGVRVARALRKP